MRATIDLEARAIEMGTHIVTYDAHLRATANKFNISKSHVHKEMCARLKAANYDLYCEVQKVFERHKAERHITGGRQTKVRAAEKRARGLYGSKKKSKAGRVEYGVHTN
jgi:putative DeoR family transcriptional regulator (stage III sporulation protein D)